VSRRRLLAVASLLGASALSCRWNVPPREPAGPLPRQGAGSGTESGRLSARPGGAPTGEPILGLQPLGLGGDRDGLLYVPQGYQPERPLPLVVMLHGAGGDGLGGLSPFKDRADQANLILLAPDSRGRTWDVLLGDYGPDVAFLDRALAQTLARYAVDPERVAVEGFSDGASYALGLGLANGDLFRRIVAFSPGFVATSASHGRTAWPERRTGPSVFISHGQADDVLPIDRCSRRIVPALRRSGYDVHYKEFPEGHTIPPEIVEEALGWLQRGQ
jgi:phospholipase/carboxylesterase